MTKIKLPTSIDKDVLKYMEKIRDEIGIPISSQIEMKFKGYSIVKREFLEQYGIDPFKADNLIDKKK